MFVTYRSNGIHRDEELARHDTFTQAFFALKADKACLFIEEDEDNEGCADAYCAGGEIRCIEPLARYNKRNPVN